MSSLILIRADGSGTIGTGHVMRCLALAQAWQRAGGKVLFVQALTTPSLEQRLRSAQVDVEPLGAERGSAEDAKCTLQLAQARGAQWVVADGYCFDSTWQQQIRAAGLRLLVIDDYGQTERYHADIVLNQNLSANASLYKRCDADTRLLLGSDFALLRQEFWATAAAPRTVHSTGRKVLVTMGGGDPDQVTGKVIQALKMLNDIEAVVAVGGSNPHLAALKSLIGQDMPGIRLVVDAINMPELMAWADVAVSAGGSTSWELARSGLAALQIILADNQRAIAEALHREGVTVNLGHFRDVDAVTIAKELRKLLNDGMRRTVMSEKGARLVDGHGARRVAAALGAHLDLTLVSDENSWINASLPELKAGFESEGHCVRWIHDPSQIEPGDLAFFLSLSRIVSPLVRRRNAHNLVVHESALPQGRGWSPLTWQILEGKKEIPVSLVEAEDPVDSGEIYTQATMHFEGHELVHELRQAQAQTTLKLCREFVGRYPFICTEGKPQHGTPSYYQRRGPADSRIDPDKTLREQFNLLRVADPDRYPAFVELGGRRFELRVSAL